MAEPARSGERILRGIPVSPGVARGRIFVVSHDPIAAVPKQQLAEDEIPHQLKRLEQALVDTRHEIQDVQRLVNQGLGAEHASIFEAHMLVLDDPTLLDEVSRLITQQRLPAEYAFQQVADKFVRTLGAINDEYLRERVSDMRDVTGRVLNKLLGR